MTKERKLLFFEVKAIVERFLAARQTAESCVKDFPWFDPSTEPLLNNIFKSIDRYLVDEDIRLKEPSYEKEQLEVVDQLFKELLNAIDNQCD